jgi:hypothetical protein
VNKWSRELGANISPYWILKLIQGTNGVQLARSKGKVQQLISRTQLYNGELRRIDCDETAPHPYNRGKQDRVEIGINIQAGTILRINFLLTNDHLEPLGLQGSISSFSEPSLKASFAY